MTNFHRSWAAQLQSHMDRTIFGAMCASSEPERVQLAVDMFFSAGWSAAEKSACVDGFKASLESAIADYKPGNSGPVNIGLLYRIVNDLGLTELVEKHKTVQRLYRPVAPAAFHAASRELARYVNHARVPLDAVRCTDGVFRI